MECETNKNDFDVNKLKDFSIYIIRAYLLKKISDSKMIIKKMKRNKLTKLIINKYSFDDFMNYIESKNKTCHVDDDDVSEDVGEDVGDISKCSIKLTFS